MIEFSVKTKTLKRFIKAQEWGLEDKKYCWPDVVPYEVKLGNFDDYKENTFLQFNRPKYGFGKVMQYVGFENFEYVNRPVLKYKQFKAAFINKDFKKFVDLLDENSTKETLALGVVGSGVEVAEYRKIMNELSGNSIGTEIENSLKNQRREDDYKYLKKIAND